MVHFTPAFYRITGFKHALNDRVRWANDGAYVQALLDPFIQEKYGAEMTVCRPTARRQAKSSFHVRYHLNGWKHGEKWVLSVDGIGKKGGNRAILPRLVALREALETNPNAPVLPSPVGFLSPLEMAVVEPPTGVRFSSLIGDPDTEVAARKLGLALASVHTSTIDLEEFNPKHDRNISLRNQVESLRSVDSSLFDEVTATSDVLEKCSPDVEPMMGPSLGDLNLKHILYNGRIAFAKTDRLALLDPSVDLGSVLAQFSLLGIKRGQTGWADELAQHVRKSYEDVAVLHDERVEIEEVRALVRLACSEAKRNPNGATAWSIIASAKSELSRN